MDAEMRDGRGVHTNRIQILCLGTPKTNAIPIYPKIL